MTQINSISSLSHITVSENADLYANFGAYVAQNMADVHDQN